MSFKYEWYRRSVIVEMKFASSEKVDMLVIYDMYGENATRTKIMCAEKYLE